MTWQQAQPKRSPKMAVGRKVIGLRSALFLFVSIFLLSMISHVRCFSINKIPKTTTPSLQRQARHHRGQSVFDQLSHQSSKITTRKGGYNSGRRTNPSRFPLLQSSNTPAEEGPQQQSSPPPPQDIVVAETSKALKRVSWLSWWCQMILTVTSAVILIFAKNVVTGIRSDAQVNFFLASTGIIISFLSIFWTWGGGARLSRRLMSPKKKTSRITAANMLRRAIDVGVSLNIIGMFLTLLGAEQTVGVLAIKVLTARPWNNPGIAGGMYAFEGSLQPLDILVVQANTNALLSHFCSLVSLLYLFRYVKKLDPPSQEEETTKGNKKKLS